VAVNVFLLQVGSTAGRRTPERVNFFFFFITLTPRVEWYTKSMSLKYEPASEPLHISVNDPVHRRGLGSISDVEWEPQTPNPKP